MWLVLALAAANLVLTPLPTEAGQWLYNKQGSRQPDPAGPTQNAAVDDLLLVALLWSRSRWRAALADETVGQAENGATVIVAVLALAVGVSSIVGVVRIGDAGAEAVWGRQS